ncbi:hypothetical protein ASG98_00035 [Bacillus sp. Soil531]|nr:hypothetical protein ASG98_00035 [Bacillus sp. Soil531]
MKNNSGRGRPQRYSDEELKSTLYKLIKEYKGPINYSLLEKHTNIPRHVWMRRMSSTVKKLNIPFSSTSTENIESMPLPNISKIINDHKDDPSILLEKLNHWNETIQNLYEKVERYEKELTVVVNLETKIKQQEKQILQLQEVINHYESLILDSSNPSYRRENHLKNNIISINSENKNHATSLDLKRQFPALFND